MDAILEWLFSLFGKRRGGQLAGAALVGAFLGALPLIGFMLGRGKNLPGVAYLAFIAAGALVAFIGDLFLLSPKRFFGTICIFLGITLVIVPLSQKDGSSASMQAYAVKTAIGLVFLLPGVLLFRPRKKIVPISEDTPQN
jgi:hypothetical protein